MALLKKSVQSKTIITLILTAALFVAAFAFLGCTAPAVCGDGYCEPQESVITCAKDCSVCGDGYCIGNENTLNCPKDCSICGDGNCTGHETQSTCPQDCKTGSLGSQIIDSPAQSLGINGKEDPKFNAGDEVTIIKEIPFIDSNLSPSEISLLGTGNTRFLTKTCALYDSNFIDLSKKTQSLQKGSYGDVIKIENDSAHKYVYANWKSQDGNIVAYGAVDDSNGCLSNYEQTIPAGTKAKLLSEVPAGLSATQPSYVDGQNYWLTDLSGADINANQISWVDENSLAKN